ncbi:Di-copper centre-containing protein [Xylariaceae sp. AK1471]|nr:Di-copper centre-containing protein [Xylariaceae sp. AK1471]
MATYAITGIQAGPKEDIKPLRLEVDDWYPGRNKTHVIQNSLFLWALNFLEAKDPDEIISYFQLAGIHGYPFVPWAEDTDAVTTNEGYCTHDSVLFPSWHRPYMILYEQALFGIMKDEVIPKLPKGRQGDWLDAAKNWRLPYWDWAQKKPRDGKDVYDLPQIAKDPRIEVLDWKDAVSSISIDNPMYKFKMPDNERMGCAGVGDVQDTAPDGVTWITIPFSKCRGTSRWADEPESGNVTVQWENGEVNNDKVAAALQSHDWYGDYGIDKIPIAEMTYRLFLPGYVKSYTEFATTKCKDTDRPATYLSLEFVHNNIHNWTGGMDAYVGHMSEPLVAAFDPIFWMHHSNVDRLFAIWQALNVNNKSNWFDEASEQLEDDGNWYIKTGAIDTPQTPLAPFFKDIVKGTYFTSDDVKDWMEWNYSYPELQPWLSKYEGSQERYLEDIRNQLKNKYSPSSLQSAHFDVVINIQYKRFALKGVPYTLYFYIGSPDELKSHEGPTHLHPNLVGFVYTFTNLAPRNRAAPGCGNCRRKEAVNTWSRAQVPLTARLLAQVDRLNQQPGAIPISLTDRHAVERHLEKNLHWKVQKHGGHEVPVLEDNPFIRVSVFHRGARFDETGVPYHRLDGATSGKPGSYALPHPS